MAEDRMAVLETLRKAIADGDVDFLREGVRVLAQAVMEAEVSELTGVATRRARPGAPADPPQRLSRAALGHPGGHDRPGHPAGPRRLVLPEPARAAPAGRAGAARGRPGGVRRRASARAGSRTSSGPWASTASAGARSAGSAPRSTPRSRPSGRRPLTDEAYPVPVARRDLRQGPRGRAGGVDGRARGDRRGDDRRAAGAGPRARPGNDEGSAWPALHPLARRARPARGPARHQRRPPGPRQGRPRAAPGLGLAALPGPLHAQRPGPRARAPPGAWSPRPSARSSSSPTRPRPGSSAAGSSTAFAPRFPAVAELLADAEADLLAHFTFPETHRRQIREHQPAGAAQQGDQAPHGGRRHLPQPRLGHPPRRHGPRRAGRRVAGRPALLPARDDGRHRCRRSTEEVSRRC